MLKPDCEGGRSWKFMGKPLSLGDYCQASGAGAQTAVRAAVRKKTWMWSRGGRQAETYQHLSICSIHMRPGDSQRNGCRLPNSSSVPLFVLKLYGEGDSRKCSSKLTGEQLYSFSFYIFIYNPHTCVLCFS